MSQFGASSMSAAGDPFSQDPSLQASQTPIWRESFFAFDWLALRTSPVYFGCGVPRGHGQPVVVVPGFLASDISLFELHSWLARIGYIHISQTSDRIRIARTTCKTFCLVPYDGPMMNLASV